MNKTNKQGLLRLNLQCRQLCKISVTSDSFEQATLNSNNKTILWARVGCKILTIYKDFDKRTPKTNIELKDFFIHGLRDPNN